MALMQRKQIVAADTSFTSSTSVEEIREFLLGIANSLCEALGLTIITDLTQDFTYGRAYFLGHNETDTEPLLSVSNAYGSSSYFYRIICISVVTSAKLPYSGSVTGTSSATTSGYYRYYIPDGLTINYFETPYGTAFKLGSTGSYSANGTFVITKATNDVDTFDVCFNVFNGGLYFSYCSALGSTTSYSAPGSVAALTAAVPPTQDALCYLYLSNGYYLVGTKMFTNKVHSTFGTSLTINGKSYVVSYYLDSYTSLITLM